MNELEHKTTIEDYRTRGYDVDSGWLSPQGVIYNVGFEGHDDFSYVFKVSQDNMFKLGWVKLGGGDWYGDDYTHKIIYVTQRQLDYIYEWCQANNRDFTKEQIEVR